MPLERAVVAPGRGVRSPARVVRARSGVVPYVARGAVLEELERWVTTPGPFAGCLVGGIGGSGKTRLGVALCARAESAQWLCGLLTATADQGAIEALVQVPTARLVVVDYAETRIEQLEQLVPLLAANASNKQPVRLVLLVRSRPSASSDWAGLLRDRSDALDAQLDYMPTWALEDHPLALREREVLFASAFTALAARTDQPHAALSPPATLAEDAFDSPLAVVIAAYLALHDDHDLPDSKAALLERLLVHEQHYWCVSAQQLDVDVTLQRRIVALATLTAADDEQHASDLLRLIPDLVDASAERRGALARWTHSLYPSGESYWNPLEPDLLGEHLVAMTYTDEPAVLAGVLDTDDAAAVIRPLDVYTRATVERPELRTTVATILSDNLKPLCDLAITQATSTTDLATLLSEGTVASALERAISVIPINPTVLPTVLNSLPSQPSLTLGPLALSLAAQFLPHARDLAATGPQQHEPILGTALNVHSARLSWLGRREDALAAVDEAVTIYRRLADARPDAFLSDLAMSLNNQANMLGYLGRHEDALAAIDDALQLVLPVLERAQYSLPDAGLRLMQNYVKRCQAAEREPDSHTMQRMHTVLASAGVVDDDQ